MTWIADVPLVTTWRLRLKPRVSAALRVRRYNSSVQFCHLLLIRRRRCRRRCCAPCRSGRPRLLLLRRPDVSPRSAVPRRVPAVPPLRHWRHPRLRPAAPPTRQRLCRLRPRPPPLRHRHLHRPLPLSAPPRVASPWPLSPPPAPPPRHLASLCGVPFRPRRPAALTPASSPPVPHLASDPLTVPPPPRRPASPPRVAVPSRHRRRAAAALRSLTLAPASLQLPSA